MATVAELETELEAAEQQPVELVEHYEVVNDQIVEEPPLGAQEIRLAARLVRAIVLFDGPGDLGEVVEEALFILRESPRLRRRPDVAFVSQERWPADKSMNRDAAWDVIPDLAVEITSPTDHVDDLMDKLEEYFAAGVRIVWVVYPKQSKVYAYDSPTSVKILQVGDELVGDPVLPGFRFPLSNLFKTPKDGPSPAA